MKSKLLWCAVVATVICPMILRHFASDRVVRKGTILIQQWMFSKGGPDWRWKVGGRQWGIEERTYAHDDGRVVARFTHLYYTRAGTPKTVILRAYQVILLAGAPVALWGAVLVRSIVRRLRH